MVRIAITHSWSLNMGDAAMLATIVDMVGGMAKDASICALVSHPEFTRQRCPDLNARLEGWPWPVPGKKSQGIFGLMAYPLIFLSNMLSATAFRLFGARIFIFNSRFREPLCALFDSDIVIHPGGDFISPDYFFMTTFGEILMARILGKKSVILAQSMGPFKGLLNRAIAAPFLKMADLIIVREKKTMRELSLMGIGNVYLTADLAFMFPKRIIRQKRGERVIICPKNLRSGKMDYARGLKRLSGRIKSEFGYEILFLPTDLHDVCFQAEIGDSLAPDVTVVKEVHSPEEIARIISSSQFIISSRMHAIILGSLSSTPFCAIGDSFKFEEILGELHGGCTLGTGGLDDEGVERIIGLMRDRKKQEKAIGKNLPAIREKSSETARILEDNLREWGAI